MQINRQTPQEVFPFLSPIFQHTLMLSPFPENTLRKYSYNNEELANFNLQYCENQNYPLFEIEQLPHQRLPINHNFTDQYQTHKYQTFIEKKPENYVHQQMPSFLQKKSEIDEENQINSESQKDEIHEKFQTNRTFTPIQKILYYLIANLNKPQIQIKKQVLKDCSCHQQTYSEIVSIFLKKFKKARKTKEEMVKYCMRKAFKFIADKMKKNRTNNRDIDSCMKIYFSKNQSNCNFSIPYKKNSIQKTMNESFLKRIFSSEAFVQDYKDVKILDDFEQLIQEDNYRKIKYLGDLIETYLKNDQTKNIQTIKRLPWTQNMLQQTLHLSKTLVQYAYKGNPLDCSKKKID